MGESFKGREEEVLKSLFQKRGELYKNRTHRVVQHPASDARKRNELVVFVHGLGHYNFTWIGFEQKFLRLGFSVCSYDLIGRGFSEYPSSGKFGLEEHVDQLHEDIIEPLLAAYNYDGIHLIGHSQGGAICIGYASMYVDEKNNKLRSMHLLAPAVFDRARGSGILGLSILKSIGCLSECLKPSITSKVEQRKAWNADFINKESETAKNCILALEASHFKKEDHERITEAIWRVLLDFPFLDMMSHVYRCREFCKDGAVKVNLIWGMEDTICRYANAEPLLDIFHGQFDEDTVHDMDDKSFQYTALMEVGHGLVLEFGDLTFVTIINAFKDWGFVEGRATPTSAIVKIDIDNTNGSSTDVSASNSLVSSDNISVSIDC